MTEIQVYKNLAWLNGLSKKKAEDAFLDCCGSSEWARRMVQSRPYSMLEDLFRKAESVWFDLSPVDWLEAFAAHPKIGSSKPAAPQRERSVKWSGDEQSGTNGAGDAVRKQLVEVNRLYLEKFGFIFIVCATGRSADEMLAICKARLGNSAATELNLAAEEQFKITEIRLNKLLER